MRPLVCVSQGQSEPNGVHLASVPRLLSARRPAAVAGLIVPVVVHALDGPARWPGPHVSHEAAEPALAQPVLADRDAAAAVAVPGDVGAARAALDHRAPRLVLRHG